VILIRTITTGSDWHCEPDAQDAIIEVTPNSRDRIVFELCWSDVRVIADRLLQALADNGQAMPVEHIDSVAEVDYVQLLTESNAQLRKVSGAPWGTRSDHEDAIAARLNGDDGPDAA
jgi:hypothetical protein